MIPQQLKDHLDKLDLDGDAGLYIRSFTWDNDEVFSEIFIRSGTSEIQDQTWTIRTSNLRKAKIDTDWANDLVILDQHFLLSEFKEIQTSLYFTGQSAHPEKLFCDLYRTHNNHYGNLIEFGYFLNKIDFTTLFSSPNGLVGQGPKDVLTVYSESLIANGLKTTFVGDREPKYWTGTQFNPESKELKLLMIGKSFFVADNFNFSKNE